MAKANKVYVVVGLVPYESEDVLGIYTSKVAAIAAATVVAERPVDYYADYTNYATVYVYEAPTNAAINCLRDEVWNSWAVKLKAVMV